MKGVRLRWGEFAKRRIKERMCRQLVCNAVSASSLLMNVETSVPPANIRVTQTVLQID